VSASPSEPFFSPTSIWNAALPDNAALDPNSSAVVGSLLQEEQISADRKSMSLQAGAPLYVVGPNQPTVAVHLNQGPLYAPLQRALDAVPLPPNAEAASTTDENLAVWQPSTNTMWEFWKMTKTATGWSADLGGRLWDVSDNPGYYLNMFDTHGNVLEQWNWGTTAASFPLMAGVITIGDLEAGMINHALGLAISDTCAKIFAAPAQRTDGDTSTPNCVPEGAHFRLDPNLDLASLHLPRLTLMMAEAAQKYGIVINNRSHGFTIRTQDPTEFEQLYGYNPFYGPHNEPGTPGALFDVWSPTAMQDFPWSHLQLLKMDVRDAPDTTPIYVH
jgi:hypothetical protein